MVKTSYRKHSADSSKIFATHGDISLVLSLRSAAAEYVELRSDYNLLIAPSHHSGDLRQAQSPMREWHVWAIRFRYFTVETL